MRLPYTDLTRVRALPNIGRAGPNKDDARIGTPPARTHREIVPWSDLRAARSPIAHQILKKRRFWRLGLK